jgi:hypothetical protein
VVQDVGILFPLGNVEKLASGLSTMAHTKVSDTEYLKNHLDQHFSDEAARGRFKDLSFVKGILKHDLIGSADQHL